MPENQIQYTESEICEENELFPMDDTSLTRLCYGDLYVLGRLWISALRAGLVGSKWNIIPVVEAAKPPPPPEKPPPMRYKDLPLYKSPHYEYKDYIEDQDKCPKRNVKLAQESLCPYVSSFRRSIQQTCCEVRCELKNMKNDMSCAMRKKKASFKQYMRDPENMSIRQGIVTIGGLTGLYIGSAKGLPTKFFTTGLGLLATGALCFPKETDEAFRTFTYHSGKTAIGIYNFYCSKAFKLRERIPCPEEMPPPPVYRKPNPCPVEK